MIDFIIIGGGWRAEFYLRIAAMLPHMFRVSAVCVRNPETAKQLREKYPVKLLPTIEETLSEPFDFIVCCINNADISALAVKLAEQGHFVLSETPALCTEVSEQFCKKIQVAEQFHLKPMYQAVKQIIDSGYIGKITHMNISCGHDYHGTSLIRFFAGKDELPKCLTAHEFSAPLLLTNGRAGEYTEKHYENSMQKIKIFDFGDLTAVYDFTDSQYFSPVRNDRLLIRGSRGEISDDTVCYFNESNQFVTEKICVNYSGALDGLFLSTVTFGGAILYKNPFAPARLSEEEIAVAECLVLMKRFIETGQPFYSYRQALSDSNMAGQIYRYDYKIFDDASKRNEL